MSDSQTTRPSHVLEDPSAKAVAQVYATAFLNAAGQDKQAELLEEFTSFHDDVLQANPDFERLLTTEATGPEQKRGVIERTVKPYASEKFTNFLLTLAKHDRLELLPLILSEAWQSHEEQQGQVRVKLRSAVELTSDQLERIKQRLHDALSFEPILIPSLDQELLGGLVIQVGDTVYDGSLRTRLRDLRQRLRERYLNEIQSGRDRFSSPEGN
ncbi:ATP synthase F1 subunit delta [Thalassoglobus sp. JC818]|uniref:ATP synthase F1 subunit delta n=1 Tax=Thalassoglobus sp. JC818 TaxID=3232136 RepID=UPI003459378D